MSIKRFKSGDNVKIKNKFFEEGMALNDANDERRQANRTGFVLEITDGCTSHDDDVDSCCRTCPGHVNLYCFRTKKLMFEHHCFGFKKEPNCSEYEYALEHASLNVFKGKRVRKCL